MFLGANFIQYGVRCDLELHREKMDFKTAAQFKI